MEIEELDRALSRLGLLKKDVGPLVGLSSKTYRNWRKRGIPKKYVPTLKKKLGTGIKPYNPVKEKKVSAEDVNKVINDSQTELTKNLADAVKIFGKLFRSFTKLVNEGSSVPEADPALGENVVAINVRKSELRNYKMFGGK